ncbi:MAG: urease accessory protein UreF [Rhodospirillales bacterium]|nr:urease accessory protein UreF [Rhodospirillales bacterium]
MGTTITTTEPRAAEAAQLYRLLAWLSPAFPTGGFSYSHGLEYAVEAGLVRDRDTALAWIDGVLRQGTGRLDAGLFALAWRAVDRNDQQEFLALAEYAAALRGTSELKLESAQQGKSFLLAAGTGWASDRVTALMAAMTEAGIEASLPVSVALTAAAHGLALKPALSGYLQAFAANLVSAAVRVIPLGQSDGLRLIAGLEAATRAAVSLGLAVRSRDELGAASPMIDWCSMRHETQYTRLFRS